MTCYMGNLGRLVPISATASLSSGFSRASTEQTTLGGRRFVRTAPRGLREWSVQTPPGTPADRLAAPSLFIQGEWGDGPFWWLSDWAVGVNALTPGGSVLKYADRSAATVGGPVQAADGTWFPGSVVSGAGGVAGVARGYARNYVAVPRGVTYTASLYVSAGQQVRVYEYDSSLGTALAARLSPAATGAGLSRVSVTAFATASTDALRLDVLGAGTCAGAAISLTRDLAPWGVGDGCAEAVFQDLSSDVTAPWMGYASQGYRVLEVGG